MGRTDAYGRTVPYRGRNRLNWLNPRRMGVLHLQSNWSARELANSQKTPAEWASASYSPTGDELEGSGSGEELEGDTHRIGANRFEIFPPRLW